MTHATNACRIRFAILLVLFAHFPWTSLATDSDYSPAAETEQSCLVQFRARTIVSTATEDAPSEGVIDRPKKVHLFANVKDSAKRVAGCAGSLFYTSILEGLAGNIEKLSVGIFSKNVSILPPTNTSHVHGQIGEGRTSKLVLLLIEVSLGGFFGLDRLYIGQFRVGIAKFLGALFLLYIKQRNVNVHELSECFDCVILTISCLIVWGIVDYISVLQKCFARENYVNMMGIHVPFVNELPCETDTAFLISFCVFAFLLVAPCIKAFARCMRWRNTQRSVGSALDVDVLKQSTRVKIALSHSRTDICNPEQGAQNQCPICLEVIAEGQEMQTLPCFHSFHHTCAVLHFGVSRENACCPVCRMLVGPESVADEAWSDQSDSDQEVRQ